VPTLSLGSPQNIDAYRLTTIDGIKLFHHENLEVRPGHSAIRFKLRKFLFLRWLELEGAKSIALYSK